MDYSKAQACSLLFDLGKTTMRPGGMEMTCKMLDGLEIGSGDDVVEIAPGPGATTRLVLKCSPRSYTAVEREKASQQKVEAYLQNGALGKCFVDTAQETGLENGCASVVFGEAMRIEETPDVILQGLCRRHLPSPPERSHPFAAAWTCRWVNDLLDYFSS